MNYGKPEDDKNAGIELPIHEQVRQSRAALCGMAPLITDESTARCVEYPVAKSVGQLSCELAAVTAERDDLARRCADLENTISRMQADYEGRGVGVRLPAAGVPQSDYDRLLASYHASTRLARELQSALGKARDEIESLKAQGPHSPVAPAEPPHGTPAALGDCLPEPARLNESIPGSAAPQVLAVTAKPAPAPKAFPAPALRHGWASSRVPTDRS